MNSLRVLLGTGYRTMKRKITGFHTDAENHWVAELECGHGQHMRHNPPWTERSWVTTHSGRQTRLGEELDCVRCDKLAGEISQKVIEECRDTLIAAYESAGASGLSGEGRWVHPIVSRAAIRHRPGGQPRPFPKFP